MTAKKAVLHWNNWPGLCSSAWLTFAGVTGEAADQAPHCCGADGAAEHFEGYWEEGVSAQLPRGLL